MYLFKQTKYLLAKSAAALSAFTALGLLTILMLPCEQLCLPLLHIYLILFHERQ